MSASRIASERLCLRAKEMLYRKHIAVWRTISATGGVCEIITNTHGRGRTVRFIVGLLLFWLMVVIISMVVVTISNAEAKLDE